MVDGVTAREQLAVHQSLHGYSEGHREIASSAQMTSRDARTVLTMSDLASAGGSVSDAGYLTGYPLSELEHYAIARTWLAPEMSRPGCVWTHTLFFAFADLQSLTNRHDIMATFRRPTPATFADYSKLLTLQPTEAQPLSLSNSASAWTRQLLSALYEYPKDKIVATTPTDFDPVPIVLAIWLQQWAQMRRTFFFCTATNSDRTTDRFWFDLQLLPNLDRGLRARFPDAKFLSDISATPDRWVDHAMQDLLEPDRGLLRTFLHSVTVKIPSGRTAFAPLTQLHQLLVEIPMRPEAVDEAILLLEPSRTVSTPEARSLVLDHAAPLAETLSVDALSFLVRNVAMLTDDAVRRHGITLARTVWIRAPESFSVLAHAGDTISLECTKALDSLSVDELLDGIQSVPDLIEVVLARRPELAADSAVWGAKGSLRDAAFSHLRQAPELWQQTITAMIASDEAELARPAFAVFGAIAIWDVLALALDNGNQPTDNLRSWLALAVSDKATIAQVLASGRIRTPKTLAAIARMTDPDDVPNDFGEDPWLTAVRNSAGDNRDHEANYFMSYLLSRALGNRSRSIADLAVIAFDVVYQAASGSTMGDDAWVLLERRLPHVPYWSRWDRCDQLRHGIAALFIDRGLDPGAFCKLSKDDSVFADLIRTAAKNWRGYSFLKRVRQALAESKSEHWGHRIDVLDSL